MWPFKKKEPKKPVRVNVGICRIRYTLRTGAIRDGSTYQGYLDPMVGCTRMWWHPVKAKDIAREAMHRQMLRGWFKLDSGTYIPAEDVAEVFLEVTDHYEEYQP